MLRFINNNFSEILQEIATQLLYKKRRLNAISRMVLIFISLQIKNSSDTKGSPTYIILELIFGN